MYVYDGMCMCMRIVMCIHAYICTSNIHGYIHVDVCVNRYLHMFMRLYISLHVYLLMHVHAYMSAHVIYTVI